MNKFKRILRKIKRIISNSLKNIILFFYIIVGFIVCSAILDYFKSADLFYTSSNTADGFTIDKFDLVLDVGLDNKIRVSEKITVNFTSGMMHGIKELTPTWNRYTSLDGNTLDRKSNITDYRAIGEVYKVDSHIWKKGITIGNKNTYLKKGPKEYIINYIYDMGNDPYEGFDEFIFYAFGENWGTEIKDANLEIHMPKSIKGYDVNFFLDKERQNNVNEIVDYHVEDNTIYAHFNDEKNYEIKREEYCSKSYNTNENGECNDSTFNYIYKGLNGALTVDIELPEDYFEGTNSTYGFKTITLISIIILLTIWTIIKWFKYGKDNEKEIETVEFYPPDNLNPAEIGYIYNKKQSIKKLTISLIIELASKGYIKIEELKDKHNNIRITNLVKKPVNIPEPKGSCTEKRKSLYNEMVLQYEKDLEEYERITSTLEELSKLEKIVHEDLFKRCDVIILSEQKEFYHTFDKVENILKNEFKHKIMDKNSKKQIVGCIIRNIAIILLSLVAYRIVMDLDPKFNILYNVAFACIFINLLFTILMTRKTEYGEILTSRVKGFRNFLITVEKPRIKSLVAENPNYFYDILPYTYVLDISNDWIKQFENIPMPEVDEYTNEIYTPYQYNSLYNNEYLKEDDDN